LGADGLIKTAAINEPRIEFNPDGSYKGLLVEPQRTNLVLRSEEFDNAYWTKQNGTVTANTQVAPDGTTTADTLTSDGGSVTADKSCVRINNVIPEDDNIYTRSIFLKKGNTRYAWLSGLGGTFSNNRQTAIFDFDDEVVTFALDVPISDVKIVKLPNGWYRLSFPLISSSGTTNNFTAGMTKSPTTVTDYDSGDFVHIWGAEAELGPTASSYIPTVASTVTRVADVVSKTGASALIGQTEGTLYADIQLTTTGFWYLSLSSGTNQNWIFIGLENNTLRGFLRSGGVTYASIQTGVITSGRFKMAIAYKLNDVVFYVNGTQIGSDTSAVMPTGLANFYLTSSEASGGNQTIIGVIKAAALLPTRLSNAQLEALTS
jgi:hypothetical protein